jgi:hypothetical protein
VLVGVAVQEEAEQRFRESLRLDSSW